jgi:hypothetical protein
MVKYTKLDHQSLTGPHAHSCTPPKNKSPHSLIYGSCTRALLVSPDRQHLFVSPIGAGLENDQRHILRVRRPAARLPAQLAGRWGQRNTNSVW